MLIHAMDGDLNISQSAVESSDLLQQMCASCSDADSPLSVPCSAHKLQAWDACQADRCQDLCTLIEAFEVRALHRERAGSRFCLNFVASTAVRCADDLPPALLRHVACTPTPPPNYSCMRRSCAVSYAHAEQGIEMCPCALCKLHCKCPACVKSAVSLPDKASYAAVLTDR